MAEKIADKTVFSLFEVMQSVRKTIETRYTSSFWVKAEMNKLNFYKHSGHCYPELVEKNEGKVVAETRAVLWCNDFNRINASFRAVLNEPLKDGIKILFKAKVQFDSKYGFSLSILDIDPSFTLGDLQREKQETITLLKKQLLFEKNKGLQLPLLPQRIAIISVETSKGYADFLNVLEKNAWGYAFFQFLFPALLQGEKAATSIMLQLKRIEKVKGHFDIVAIIRGGGGDIGLSCYNNFELAEAICNFPIPVLTGIGHSTNETVTEMIAHFNAITPTKLAEFLIQKFHNFSMPVQEAERKITDRARQLLADQHSKLDGLAKLFRSVSSKSVLNHSHLLQTYQNKLTQQSRYRITTERGQLSHIKNTLAAQCRFKFAAEQNELQAMGNNISSLAQYQFRNAKNELNALEKNISNLDPKNVLRRGYSITLVNGKAIENINAIQTGDEIKTLLFNGEIVSKVKEVKNNSNE